MTTKPPSEIAAAGKAHSDTRSQAAEDGSRHRKAPDCGPRISRTRQRTEGSQLLPAPLFEADGDWVGMGQKTPGGEFALAWDHGRSHGSRLVLPHHLEVNQVRRSFRAHGGRHEPDGTLNLRPRRLATGGGGFQDHKLGPHSRFPTADFNAKAKGRGVPGFGFRVLSFLPGTARWPARS